MRCLLLSGEMNGSLGSPPLPPAARLFPARGEFPPGWEPLLTREQADRYHVLALCLEYTKVVVPEFSFNLNDNLRNDAHRKLGPVYGVALYLAA